MKPVPARQRRQAHRQRLAFARALHQIPQVKDAWMTAWLDSCRGQGPHPERIKLPKMLQHRARELYNAFFAS